MLLLSFISKFGILFLLYNPRIFVMTAASVINPAFSFCSWGNRGPGAVRWFGQGRAIVYEQNLKWDQLPWCPFQLSFCFQAKSLYVSSSYLARKNWWPDKISHGHWHFWHFRLYKTSKTVSIHSFGYLVSKKNFFFSLFLHFKGNLRFDSSVLRDTIFHYFLVSIYQC